jgi:hypothetical protein
MAANEIAERVVRCSLSVHLELADGEVSVE